MKQIRGIKETCLYVVDLEATRKFYHEILEFPIISNVPGRHIFFRSGESVLLCFNPTESRRKKSPPAHYAEGNQHLAFEVLAADYEGVKQKLLNKDVKIIDTVSWSSGQESFYFHDPEKNVLEIVPYGVWDS